MDYIVQYADGKCVAYHSRLDAEDELMAHPDASLIVQACGHFDMEER